MVGTTAAGLIVIGKDPLLKANGTYTNRSDTINTSKGGGPTTIGVDNQMFNPKEGAYFTFVNNPVQKYLAGAPGGLTQKEADDADNIQYTGGTLETSTAFAEVSQIQGNKLATMKITTYDLAHYDASGVSVTIKNGVATVLGLDAGYKVEWDTSAPADQVLIEDVAGKFDIGGFGTVQAQPTPDQKLDFVAKVTDGDGDLSTDAFSVGIDGTGIYHDGTVTGVTVA